MTAYLNSDVLPIPEFADDFISRGWDYLDFIARYKRKWGPADRHQVEGYLNLRNFLDHGWLFQKDAEEYNVWERNSEGKRRDSVDGITVRIRYECEFTGRNRFPKTFASSLEHTTGLGRPFEYNTLRASVALYVPGNLWALSFWASDGYNSDLAGYYKDVFSWGLGIEIR